MHDHIEIYIKQPLPLFGQVGNMLAWHTVNAGSIPGMLINGHLKQGQTKKGQKHDCPSMTPAEWLMWMLNKPNN